MGNVSNGTEDPEMRQTEMRSEWTQKIKRAKKLFGKPLWKSKTSMLCEEISQATQAPV